LLGASAYGYQHPAQQHEALCSLASIVIKRCISLPTLAEALQGVFGNKAATPSHTEAEKT
jgi:hypothetical protein